ncbi:MAG: phosphate butyryltransferase [Symbiobacteriia bacterium]
MRDFASMVRAAQAVGPRTLAVAAAADADVLEAVKEAQQQGLCSSVLIGGEADIRRIAGEIHMDLTPHRVVNEPNPLAAARKAVELVRQGEAQLLMKGFLQTSDLLRAVLDKESGLRTGRALSHVMVIENPGYDRLFILTDVAFNVAPDLPRKVELINNAVGVCKRLGIENPKTAVLAAVETVNADMPATVEAALLAKMADRGQIKGTVVDGPLALDNAISEEAAHHKGITSPVAGQADILLVPDIEAGNMLYKGMVYFGQARAAGVVVGASAPVVLLSRADRPESKLLSIALALLLTN